MKRPSKPAGRKRSLPNLSEAQEGKLWPMLTAAMTEAARSGKCEDTTAAKTAWRKQYLGEKCGIQSLTSIPRVGTLYAAVMGALQEVTMDGIDWIMQAGAKQPEALVWHLRNLMKHWSIAETYAQGIARNCLQLSRLPELDELEAPQLIVVARIIHAQGARIADAARKEQVPF